MRPNQFISYLVVEHNDCARPLRRNGALLSKSDATSVQEVFVQWTALLYDIGILPLECDKRIVRHIISDLYRNDIMSVLNAFADALSCLLTQKHGFKAHVKKVSPHLWQFIAPMWEKHLSNEFDSTRNLIQVLSYCNRLSLKEIDLTAESISDYIANEDAITGNEINNSYIPHLKEIIKRWVKDINFDDLNFKHGPGGVATHGRTSISEKDKSLCHDSLIRYAFKGPFSVFHDTLQRQSQTIFVAKNYKTFRTISMEPATLMYYQQGVWNAIDKHVQSRSYLRHRIGFHDQTRNQLLAREGSFLRNYATIDLSAASDTVTWQLVKTLFSDTRLYRYLLTTRSRTTLLPDGQTIELKKFAPMGSALNFPIETIIFASVCEFVTREHGVSGDYSVYGDDIIVPTEIASDIKLVLSQLGFRVNEEKSFIDPVSPYRESCGGEYWCGNDVTPLRISRNYTSHDITERFESLVEGANQAFHRNFRLLRQFFLWKMNKLGTIPYFSPVALLTDSSSNYHADRRWNHWLQRHEVRVSVLASKVSKRTQCESLRYNHWLRSCKDRPGLSSKDKLEFRDFIPFVSVIETSTVYVTRKWRPLNITSLTYPMDNSKKADINQFFIN